MHADSNHQRSRPSAPSLARTTSPTARDRFPTLCPATDDEPDPSHATTPFVFVTPAWAALAAPCAYNLIFADNRHLIHRIRQILEIVPYRLRRLLEQV